VPVDIKVSCLHSSRYGMMSVFDSSMSSTILTCLDAFWTDDSCLLYEVCVLSIGCVGIERL